MAIMEQSPSLKRKLFDILNVSRINETRNEIAHSSGPKSSSEAFPKNDPRDLRKMLKDLSSCNVTKTRAWH